MPTFESNSTESQKKGVPCRTCTDFKSWSKLQRESLLGSAGKQNNDTVQRLADPSEKEIDNKSTIPSNTKTKADEHGCPYDKDDLGKSTWGLLHTMAAYYPDKPTEKDQTEISSFFTILSKFYPCDICATDFQKEIQNEPVITTSQNALSQWVCRQHNKVNVKLGKPVFDCNLVNERWRDGWKDGSCDG